MSIAESGCLLTPPSPPQVCGGEGEEMGFTVWVSQNNKMTAVIAVAAFWWKSIGNLLTPPSSARVRRRGRRRDGRVIGFALIWSDFGDKAEC